MKSEQTGLYKIGLSLDPERRRDQIERASGDPIKIVHVIETRSMKRLEDALHEAFRDKWHHDEWFMLSGPDIDQFKTVTDDYLNDPYPLSVSPPKIRKDMKAIQLSNGKICQMVSHRLSNKKAIINYPGTRPHKKDGELVTILGRKADIKPNACGAFIVKAESGKLFTISRVMLDVQK